jgi:NO-binding membrane sensor protein with MHYT domain
MGIAVCGMHYTGMYAIQLHFNQAQAMATNSMPLPSTGMTASQLLAPLIIGITASSLVVMFLVVLSPTEGELRLDAEMSRNLEAIRSRR